jgi:hypothetical protein
VLHYSRKQVDMRYINATGCWNIILKIVGYDLINDAVSSSDYAASKYKKRLAKNEL